MYVFEYYGPAVSNSTRTYRVALMSRFPAGLEDDMIHGALDYVEHSPRWRFSGHGHRPFGPFQSIDLKRVDGVIGFFYRREWADAVADAGVAAVDTWAEHEHLGLPRITNDDLATGRLGAEHLLARGLAAFGFVTTDTWNLKQRLAGFNQTLVEAGRGCDVLELPFAADAHDQRVGRCMRWLDRQPKPIGIMSAADYLAIPVVEAAQRLGLSIPDDVAVVGATDDRWASAVAAVPLSSVQLNMRQVGYRAAKLLNGLMEGELPPPPRLVPPVGVIARRSTDIVVSDDPLVSHALRYTRDHIGDGINVEDVLFEVGVSRATLVKRMKQAVGQVPSQAISRARVELAKQLLLTTDLKMEEIARRCGFSRHPRLHEVFKRITGVTPGQYRQQRSP